MTVNVKKNRLTFGYIAPCALIYRSVDEIPPINQFDGNTVFLLSIWKTRCNTPRIDIVLWLPWKADGHRISLVGGTPVGEFLKYRYCDPTESFDIKAALRYVGFRLNFVIFFDYFSSR